MTGPALLSKETSTGRQEVPDGVQVFRKFKSEDDHCHNKFDKLC